ncbi:beta-microseminoprotein-like [Clavelina lepadiformis]|uniref:beta-microseminoprotein-like n=1 Tax=Clavelina lepadiformis TaxID=159417 RepID=UPI0040414FA4
MANLSTAVFLSCCLMLAFLEEPEAFCLMEPNGCEKYKPGDIWETDDCLSCECVVDQNGSDVAACCSIYSTPTGVHEDCEVIWKQEECKYDVIDKNTKGPCGHMHGVVGK